MKSLIPFVFAALFICAAIKTYAQTKSVIYHLTGPPGVANKTDGIVKRGASSTIYVPSTEVDSIYEPDSIPAWLYESQKTITYYQSNCLDSMVTFADQNGANLTRETFRYDQNNNVAYNLHQAWNADSAKWINTTLSLLSSLSASCFPQDEYDLTWNGAAWDTLNFSFRTTADYDSYSNPTLLVRQSYLNGEWVNIEMHSFSYDALHRLSGSDVANWDNTSQQFIPLYRDTNYIYINYDNICKNSPQSYENQKWTGSSWQNYEEYFFSNNDSYTNDTVYTLTWNGTVYDSSQIEIFKTDNYNHFLSDISYNYDSTAHSWSTLFFYNVDSITYGANNEIVRVENYTNFNNDSIFPNTVAKYSNFTPCPSASAGIQEIAPHSAATISPNPLTSSSIVQFNSELKDAEAVMFDLPGKEIMKKQFSGNSIVIEKGNLSDGIYFLRVTDKEKQYMQKIIVQ